MRHLSLFTGSGIGDHAAELCGIEAVAQCEIDPCCMYCLERLFPKALKFKDVHDVSAKSLGSVLPIDIISGGFPCQNLSTAGRGEGIEGSRSGLWREMFRVIRQVRPAWLVIENVPAIRLRGVDRVIAPLERIGYTCWPLVVGAWAVGAPHKRDRVWIVAHRPRKCWEQRAERDGIGVCGGAGRADCEMRGCEFCYGTGYIGGNADWGLCPMGHADATRRRTRSTERKAGERPKAPGEMSTVRCETVAQPQEHGLQRQRPAGVKEPITRCEEAEPERIHSLAIRWPARPGEPQHEWEAPRLAQFSVGDATDGLAGRVRSRANKALLRMVGNGWCYPNALLVYQWIVTQEAEHGSNAGGKDS